MPTPIPTPIPTPRLTMDDFVDFVVTHCLFGAKPGRVIIALKVTLNPSHYAALI